MKNTHLADTLKIIVRFGKKGFYEGEVAQSMINELSKRGSLISMKDLANDTSTFVEPISLSILDHKLWEIPPSGFQVL